MIYLELKETCSHVSDIKIVSKGEKDSEAEQEPEPGQRCQLIQGGSEVVCEGGDNLKWWILSYPTFLILTKSNIMSLAL